MSVRLQSGSWKVVVWSLCLSASVLLSAKSAWAQDTQDPAPVSDTDIKAPPKGAVGLGLIGAELGLVLPAIAGLRSSWAFYVFPAVGAIGGAAAGYFWLDKSVDNATISVAVLAGGMALIIPSLLFTLSLTTYNPEEERSQRSTGFASSESSSSSEKRFAQSSFRQRHFERRRFVQHRVRSVVPEWAQSGGFVRASDRGLGLGVPSFVVGGMYSQEELKSLQISQRPEVQVPLFSARF